MFKSIDAFKGVTLQAKQQPGWKQFLASLALPEEKTTIRIKQGKYQKNFPNTKGDGIQLTEAL